MDTALGSYKNATDGWLLGSISHETFHELSWYGIEHYFKNEVAFDISMLVICSFGAVGNGIVLWLLIFRIQRNPFLTYILNLAVADLGVLLSVIVLLFNLWFRLMYGFHIVFIVFFLIFLLMYSSSQFLLTAISIDRCVAVFFPLWHQCKRPPRLSTIVCAVIWVFSFLLTAITCTLMFTFVVSRHYFSQHTVNAVLCVPVMTMATGALFIKVCFKAPQHRRGKRLTIILLTLLFFLFFALPLNITYIMMGDDYYLYSSLADLPVLFFCLNSSVNPVIYFLVGRQWKSQHKENLRMILQKIFKEEEGCSGRQETPVETQL